MKEDRNILYSTKNAATIVLKDSVLQDVLRGDASPDILNVMEGLGFMVPSLAQESAAMKDYMKVCDGLNSKLSLLVVLNLSCNLACPYCFENSVKGSHFMSEETENDLINFIAGNIPDNKKEISVTFYGGEPLLSLDTITRISGRLNDLASNNELRFSFSLVTNGTLLTSRVVQQLKPLGLIGAKVTLDGPRSTHNVSRPFRSGEGSFDIIIENLKQVCRDTVIQIGGNYARNNYTEFPELLNYLVDEGLTPDLIKSVKFDPVTAVNKSAVLKDCAEWCMSNNEQWVVALSVFLREAIMKRGFKTQFIRPSRCVIESGDFFVVNYNGDLYKCPGFTGNEDFKAGTLKEGVKQYNDIYSLDNWKNDECLSCCYLPLCFGGCRYMRFIAKGDIAGVDCRKDYYDASLKELVLQDIEFRHR
ncbi:MAG TPA: geopeptide radical SAM maturase [Dissulfurispiraceae bacterium]|nr:geopeptide radical SAM maturase [Dissulfurispiraceae bacterium]